MKIRTRVEWPAVPALVASAALSLYAQQEPVPLEAIVSLQTVGDVRMAPDGGQVAYVLGRESTAPGARTQSEIWLVSSNGGSPRRLLAGGGAESEPRWSPDGRSLIYAAVRGSGGRQLYLAGSEGTGERLLAPGTAGASRIEWSPNGKYVSFIRRDPGASRKPANDPVVSGSDEADRLWVLELATGRITPITPADLGVSRNYAWSPDSSSIVVPTQPAGEWIAGRQTLFVAFVDGRPARALSTPLHDRTIWVAWSPDGSRIAWCGREHTPGSGQLLVFDASSGRPQIGRSIHPDFRASIEWIGFLPDGRLVLAALNNVRVGLYTTTLDGSPIAEAASPDAFRPGSLGSGSWARFGLSFSADGRRFATTHSAPREPGNVVAGDWGKPESVRTLTRLNSGLEQYGFGETEVISWKAPDGLEIFGLLIKPLGYQKGRRYPLVVEAHGGPRRSFWDTCNLTDSWGQLLATRGYLVLLPNPRGSEGRGPEFIRAGADEGGADLPDILAGVDAVIRGGDADPERLGIAGWSYGGFLTAWAITQTPRFKAAVVGAGFVNRLSHEGQTRGNWQAPREPYDHPEKLLLRSPIMYVKRVKTPTLILHGGNDNTVPTVQSIELYTALRALAVPTEHVVYPGETHIFTDSDHMIDLRRRIVQWFDRYLRSGPPVSRHRENRK